MTRYTKEMHEAYRKEQDEKREREERERRERIEKENARHAYLAEGGTADEFERGWPEMWEEARRRRVLEREAREGMRSSGVSRI